MKVLPGNPHWWVLYVACLNAGGARAGVLLHDREGQRPPAPAAGWPAAAPGRRDPGVPAGDVDRHPGDARPTRGSRAAGSCGRDAPRRAARSPWAGRGRRESSSYPRCAVLAAVRPEARSGRSRASRWGFSRRWSRWRHGRGALAAVVNTLPRALGGGRRRGRRGGGVRADRDAGEDGRWVDLPPGIRPAVVVVGASPYVLPLTTTVERFGRHGRGGDRGRGRIALHHVGGRPPAGTPTRRSVDADTMTWRDTQGACNAALARRPAERDRRRGAVPTVGTGDADAGKLERAAMAGSRASPHRWSGPTPDARGWERLARFGDAATAGAVRPS